MKRYAAMLTIFTQVAAHSAAIQDISADTVERQLTDAPHGHLLTNSAVWSPDSRWIVYDVRSADNVFDGTRIAQVDIETKAVQVLYETKNGAGCAVASYHPKEAKVVFIAGPEHPTNEWSYAASRRRGVWVDVNFPHQGHALDAMNYAPPFVAGALRGGSHVHLFSPDGNWVSFTYDDEVLTQLGASPERADAQINQRNVAVAANQPVRVAKNHPRNHDGDFFSVVVTRTVNQPQPGSDQISRAFEEGWVGRNGYVRRDGTRQKRALAFLGLVRAPDGKEHAEVFIVDLPGDLTQAGGAPLEGTTTTRPAPPRGTVQRRLTFTSERRHPGVALQPRHWMRASADGTQIAFLMKDDAGVVQLWTVSPNGGEPRQVSRHAWDVASAFTWSPDSRAIAHVMDHSIFLTEVTTGESRRLTPRRAGAEAPQSFACVYSPDGQHVAYLRRVNGFSQIFIVSIPQR
ncbi:DUF3748 domain-containing protein [Oleiharenicola lentus]|uniref:DUF3748 domain-containing protein n=1 Tax=Oleiharenicola lentus TaxID=2508720 RepID=UPI003F6701C2